MKTTICQCIRIKNLITRKIIPETKWITITHNAKQCHNKTTTETQTNIQVTDNITNEWNKLNNTKSNTKIKKLDKIKIKNMWR